MMTPAVRAARAKADMELIGKIREGVDPQEDFRRLYERYAPATFAFFLRRSGDADLAADLNQDLYLRLAKSIESFEGRCSWRTWVFLVARAVLADSRSSRWAHLAERSVELDAKALARELSFGHGADAEAERVLLRDRLRICLVRLSDIARAVVIGHYFDGVTLREMTERLQLDNKSGSRAVLIKAQRKLKRCMNSWRTS